MIVSERTEGHALEHWLVPRDSSGDAHIHEFTARPGFPRTARRLASNMLDLAAKNPGFDGMAKDVGRFVVSTAAIVLDSTGGITVPRLKELCAIVGLTSPGRARAILFYLLFLGLIVSDGKTGRVTRYVGTTKLRETWKLFLRARLDACSLLEPVAREIAAKLDDPSYFAALVAVLGSAVPYIGTRVDRRSAFQTRILDRNAGMQFIHYLALQQQEDDEYPAAGPIHFSLRDAARRLRVSRPHLIRMLRGAEAAGLLTLGNGGSVEFTPATRDEIRFWVGFALTAELFSAARLAADWGQAQYGNEQAKPVQAVQRAI